MKWRLTSIFYFLQILKKSEKISSLAKSTSCLFFLKSKSTLLVCWCHLRKQRYFSSSIFFERNTQDFKDECRRKFATRLIHFHCSDNIEIICTMTTYEVLMFITLNMMKYRSGVAKWLVSDVSESQKKKHLTSLFIVIFVVSHTVWRFLYRYENHIWWRITLSYIFLSSFDEMHTLLKIHR